MMSNKTTPELATIPVVKSEAINAKRNLYVRYFFAGMASVFIIIALFGFVPSYQDMYSGTFPIHWTAHIHGALMTGWLLIFLTQAMLAVNNRIKIHRQLGQYAVLLGVLIWISMGSSSFRAIIGYDPPVGHYLFDVLLLQLSSMNSFALFFVWGIIKRKNVIVHKRLFFLATLSLMSAAINRIQWLPESIPSIIYLNSFLLLLFLYDLLVFGRIQKITWSGALIFILLQFIAIMFMGKSGLHIFWFDFFNQFR